MPESGSPFGQLDIGMTFPHPVREQKNAHAAAMTRWFDWLVADWDHYLSSDTWLISGISSSLLEEFTSPSEKWHEVAKVMNINPEEISTAGQFDNSKLADYFMVRAEKLADDEVPVPEQFANDFDVLKEEKPWPAEWISPEITGKRYVLDYEPFPEGVGFPKEGKEGIEEETGEKKKEYVNRVVFLKKLLAEIKLQYSLASNDLLAIDLNKHSENTLESKTVWQFYIYDLSKAVFVSNEPEHATIIIHNVLESEVKPIASGTTRIRVQEIKDKSYITRVFWPTPGTVEEKKEAWLEKIKVELSKVDNFEPEKNELVKVISNDTRINDDEYYRDVEVVDEPSPEGWMTISAISKFLARNRDWVGPRIKKLLASGNTEFKPKKFHNVKNQYRYTIFFTPEMIAELSRQVEQEQHPPEGWLVIGSKGSEDCILHLIKQNLSWVVSNIHKVLQENPGWEPKYFLDKKNRLRLYYPPKLINNLIELDQPGQHPPEGWSVIGNKNDGRSITFFVKRNQSWVFKRIKKLITKHPEWEPKLYLNRNNALSPHYPPELIAELVLLAEQERHPPEGWLVLGEKIDSGVTVSSLLKRNADWIKLRIKKLIVEHPEWEPKPYLNRNNELSPHYPPELIAELVLLAEQERHPPEGWLVIGRKNLPGTIAFLLERDKEWVNPRIKKLITKHPEWEPKLYLNRNNALSPHYPSELINFLFLAKNNSGI